MSGWGDTEIAALARAWMTGASVAHVARVLSRAFGRPVTRKAVLSKRKRWSTWTSGTA
jgi:hypothetical protein